MNPLIPIVGVSALVAYFVKKSSDEADAAQNAQLMAQSARLSAQDAALSSIKADAEARKKAEDDARAQAEAKAKEEAAKKAAAEKKAGTDLESLKASVVYSANALNATNFMFQTINPIIKGKSIGLLIRMLIDNEKATKTDYFGWLTVLNSEYDGRMKAGGPTSITAAINKLRSALYHYGIKFFGMG